MLTPRTHNWRGLSGRWYQVEIRSLHSQWHEVPAIYFFARPCENGYWTPLYIGQASNLKQRLSGHEDLPKALRLGATHIHGFVAPSNVVARRAMEADLINNLNPLLNDQHRTGPSGLPSTLLTEMRRALLKNPGSPKSFPFVFGR